MKPKLLSCLFAITATLAAGQTSATVREGTAVSGGGGAVYCKKAKTAELFDYYEARTLRRIEVDLGATNLDVMEKVKMAIERIAKFDPARAAKYLTRATSFDNEARYLPNVILPEVLNSNGAAFPSGCELRQVAVQKEPKFPQDPYYLISKDLWDLMSNDSRAGLILHEIIYREAIEKGQRTSVNARYYNSIVSSADFSKYDLDDYLDLADLAGLYVEFQWLDPHTGATWYLGNLYSRAREDDANAKCSSIGARVAYERDLILGYPQLGKALANYRMFNGRGWESVMIGDDYWKGGQQYIIREKNFSLVTNPGGYHAGRLLCIFDPKP